MTFPTPHLVPLGVCLLVAACWDVARRRVPNVVTAAAALSGLTVRIVDGGGWGGASGLAAGALVIAILYRPWTMGGIGGGDVKLAAAVGVWVGLEGLIRFALATAAAGGLVAAGAYLYSSRAVRREVKQNLTLAVYDQQLPVLTSQAPGRVSVPYGLAIAAGAIVALWRS